MGAKVDGASAKSKNALCLVDLPEYVDIPGNEVVVQKMWEEKDCFRTSLKMSEGKKPFTFYDGPPFATGLPHYGHILAGTIKDVVTRWAHQTGHYVERRFGWDCHGLPIEFEIEKQQGIKTSHDVMKIGIKQYNQYCREIVMRYSAEWKKTVQRMGRWIDFENDYKTMNLSYMESVWWVFGQLWDKPGMVYRGYKVMPYSMGCTTVLSNFEANMNYQDVSDPSVVVTFPWVEDKSICFVAWTTTPWTLPSNLGLCVHPTMKYVLIKEKESGKKFILAEARLVQMYPKLPKLDKSKYPFEVIEEYTGKELAGRQYVPLFNFFERKEKDGAFRILVDEYVTSDSGTGIVHQAPAFGEDDYRVCLSAKVIAKNEEVPCPVDGNGCFTDEVPDWKGINVKEADKAIQAKLKETGRLFSAGAVKHSYPFCWRSNKPLIYKAISSWFVNVESIKDQLLENNAATYWVPDHVKTGRFNNWLENARDWAVSRNRYWGTPLPIWVSEDYSQQICVKSVAELSKLTGKEITDIHRDSVDDLEIPDPRGPDFPPLKRVPEVFDCWFESGSMPYAQSHYPFENVEKFENGFPADFIAEGIDQTRGWFYTLMVLSTAIKQKPAFKNLIVNGLVLASDGRKMSKSLQNYPDPNEVIAKYGADAVRLYLINSPVVRGQELKFKEEGVKDVVKDVLLPISSALNFFTINYNRLILSGESFDPKHPISNVMDRWITAAAAKLVKDVTSEMKLYHLYSVVPCVVEWIQDLTNCYVRMNRRRLKGSLGLDDCKASLATLFNVLMITARIMGPFTPFMAEQIYGQLRELLPKDEQMDSVHYHMIPEAPEAFDESIIRKVSRLQQVCVMVRTIRDRAGKGLRKPVREVVVISDDQQYVDDITELSDYVKEEVFTFNLKATTEEGDYVETKAVPNNRALGAKYKGESAKIRKAINADALNVAKMLRKDKKVTLAGCELTSEDIDLVSSCKEGVSGYESHASGQTVVLVDMTDDEETLVEGTVREILSRVQQLRKRAGLSITDKVGVYFETTDETFEKAFTKKLDFMQDSLKSKISPLAERTDKDKILVEQVLEELTLVLVMA
eukprot:TRINITY_DN253_c13_g1_i1.p1 TRINITY_DN253_c13_g1~~TRINITY_DN253_c13_g1_i1.p1  ORF type:complete len:1203 (+),score=327.51 TRINITY_DN253_c13_g1_i1:371-3610(+)